MDAMCRMSPQYITTFAEIISKTGVHWEKKTGLDNKFANINIEDN